jgi:hypothetical protein
MGVGFREIGGEAWQPWLCDDHVRRRVIGGGAVDNDQRAKLRILAGHRIEADAKLGIGDGDGRA